MNSTDYPSIFAATLGISDPWQITDVRFSTQEKRLDITLTYTAVGTILCPCCGTANPVSHSTEEVWFHSDFFCHATYLHTTVPHIKCCRVLAVERPWSHAGSRFSQTNLH